MPANSTYDYALIRVVPWSLLLLLLFLSWSRSHISWTLSEAVIRRGTLEAEVFSLSGAFSRSVLPAVAVHTDQFPAPEREEELLSADNQKW